MPPNRKGSKQVPYNGNLLPRDSRVSELSSGEIAVSGTTLKANQLWEEKIKKIHPKEPTRSGEIPLSNLIHFRSAQVLTFCKATTKTVRASSSKTSHRHLDYKLFENRAKSPMAHPDL